MRSNLPLRAPLTGLSPYGAPHLDVPVCLNVNENPYPPSPAVVAEIADAVAQAAGKLNRYPERDFDALRTELASYLTVESGVELAAPQIWAGNGSNEVMLHILQAFGGPGQPCLSFTPTYSMYPEYARDTVTEYITGERTSEFKIDPDAVQAAIAAHHPSVLLLASPNNPTGTALPQADIVTILDAARAQGPQRADGSRADVVVVIDEAYGEFRRAGVPSALELLADNPHLAVSRTMSKAFGMAGLRLGYLAAAPELIDCLRVVRLPYHLSAVSQATALAALKHRDELMAQVSSLRQERDDTVVWLREQGLDTYESDANFVLFGPFRDRHATWQGLVDRGVLVREVGPDGYLRVCMGTPDEMQQFRRALLETMADSGQTRNTAHSGHNPEEQA